MNCGNKYSPEEHNVEEVKIPVPWGHVAGRWWGPKDKQPVLATHGWQDNAGTWDNLIPLLPPSLPVLCIDFPGMGLSSHYPKGMIYYKMWDNLALLRRIVKFYKWNKVNLMGHSLGGAVSFLYAATFPDEVESIICIDIASPTIQSIDDSVNTIAMCIDQMLRYEDLNSNRLLLDSYESMIDFVHQAYKGSVSRENCKVLMKRGMNYVCSQRGKGYYYTRDSKLKYSTLAMIYQDDSLEYASKIKCKVLNIRAVSPENRPVDDFYIKVMNKIRETADLTFVEVEGTHHLHLDTPERVDGIIAKFLAHALV